MELESKDKIENVLKIIDEDKKREDLEELRQLLGEAYELRLKILSEWVDIKESYKPLLAIWTLGTLFHNQFNSYPYLFINASKGSGKTRLMNVLKDLSNNGEVIMSLTDATLFRSSNDTTMFIDEFEGLGLKDKSTLREILNACYKKGTKIKRLRKVKDLNGETQKLEEFLLYRALVIANINGMEEVLGDRCIPIYLEKSFNMMYMSLLEGVEQNKPILSNVVPKNDKNIGVGPNLLPSMYSNYTLDQTIHESNLGTLRPIDLKIKEMYVYVDFLAKNIKKWNDYVRQRYGGLYNNIYITIHNYTFIEDKKENANYTYEKSKPTLGTNSTLTLKEEQFFNKIACSGIIGRPLELFFNLFQLANFIDPFIFDQLLEFAKELYNEKGLDEVTESKDIMFYSFVAKKNNFEYYGIKDLTNEFRYFVNADSKEMEEINTQWLGCALKRLGLILNKKRETVGIKVMLNIQKALIKEKLYQDKICTVRKEDKENVKD